MVALVLTSMALAADPAHLEPEWRRMYLEATLPDPHVAFDMSAKIGFGTGHFYAQDPAGGRLHAGVQASGLAVGATGFLLYANVCADGHCNEDARAIWLAVAFSGATTFLVDRVVDALTAPRAAHRFAAKQIQAAAPP